MSDKPTPESGSDRSAREHDKRLRLDARRHNERLKLAAGALDRASTVILGRAVLAPIFQNCMFLSLGRAGWFLGAGVQH